jgi:hypothetical protein
VLHWLFFEPTFEILEAKIGIFGIIAEGSDFPEMTLQNCKSDTTTPLKQFYYLSRMLGVADK